MFKMTARFLIGFAQSSRTSHVSWETKSFSAYRAPKAELIAHCDNFPIAEMDLDEIWSR